MKKLQSGFITLLFAAVLLVSLTGCAALQVAIEKRDLSVATKMSDTVFLDPVPSSMKTIYLQVRNTSDRQDVRIEEPIRLMLAARGYRIVTDNPEDAHYIVQVNLLQAGKQDISAAERDLSSGFGGAVAGVAIGLATDSSDAGLLVGGIAGGAAEVVVNSLVKDVTHSLTTDIRISEKTTATVTTRETQKIRQGSAGVSEIRSTETGHRKTYQTRVVSLANKVNLKFEEARPELVRGLATAISGLF